MRYWGARSGPTSKARNFAAASERAPYSTINQKWQWVPVNYLTGLQVYWALMIPNSCTTNGHLALHLEASKTELS